MTRVPVAEIASERLTAWVAECVKAHATPMFMLAIGHDWALGTVHAFRTEDGPTDHELGLLVSDAALQLLHSDR